MKIKENFNIQELLKATQEIESQDFGSLKYGKKRLNLLQSFIEDETNHNAKKQFNDIKEKLFKHVWEKR